MTVTAVAFRHKIPGEGVGGFEWHPEAAIARERIDAIGVFTDPNYETTEQTFEFPDGTDRDTITDEIDAALWNENSR